MESSCASLKIAAELVSCLTSGGGDSVAAVATGTSGVAGRAGFAAVASCTSGDVGRAGANGSSLISLNGAAAKSGAMIGSTRRTVPSVRSTSLAR
jgi:hypothetical protein